MVVASFVSQWVELNKIYDLEESCAVNLNTVDVHGINNAGHLYNVISLNEFRKSVTSLTKSLQRIAHFLNCFYLVPICKMELLMPVSGLLKN